jgi:polar amino acid transport system permease protein
MLPCAAWGQAVIFSFGPEGWGDELARGAALTLLLALATLPVGLALGLAVALAKDSRNRFAQIVGEGYTTVFRGIPELLMLLLIYYGAQIALDSAEAATGLPISFPIPPFVAGMLALGLVFGAYSSEVLLAALRGIERGQIEAASSFGMSEATIFRRVTLPQMMRLALPGLGNNWLVMLKDTSLVSTIALSDLLRQTTVAVDNTKLPFEFYAAACAIYLAMTALSTAVLALAERRARRGWREA